MCGRPTNSMSKHASSATDPSCGGQAQRHSRRPTLSSAAHMSCISRSSLARSTSSFDCARHTGGSSNCGGTWNWSRTTKSSRVRGEPAWRKWRRYDSITPRITLVCTALCRPTCTRHATAAALHEPRLRLPQVHNEHLRQGKRKQAGAPLKHMVLGAALGAVAALHVQHQHGLLGAAARQPDACTVSACPARCSDAPCVVWWRPVAESNSSNDVPNSRFSSVPAHR